MLRFLAPAGAPLAIEHIARAMGTSLFCNGRTDNALKGLATDLHMRYFFPTCSGRAGLLLILRGLHSLRPDRNVVALPAYTCFSVAAAIVRAGMKLHPVEIDPETLDFDFDQLAAVPEKRLLCILTSHLFGLVNDIRRIQSVAQSKGAFLIDDAAQALGGLRGGIAAGAGGDVGLYSFGRGKVLGTISGGLVVTNSEEIARAVEAEFRLLPTPSWKVRLRVLVETPFYSIFLKPSRYWIPNLVPFLKLGATEFNLDFPVTRIPPLASALIARLVCQVEGLNAIRAKNAGSLAEALSLNTSFTTPRPTLDGRATYVRFAVVARDAAARSRAVAELRAAGIGATSFYPSAICDIEEIGSHMAADHFHRPNAEDLARRLLTLPTHPHVQAGDLRTMAEILGRS